MWDPLRAAEPDGCAVLVDPRRKPTLASIIDGFLETKLTDKQKAALLQVIRGTA